MCTVDVNYENTVIMKQDRTLKSVTEESNEPNHTFHSVSINTENVFATALTEDEIKEDDLFIFPYSGSFFLFK